MAKSKPREATHVLIRSLTAAFSFTFGISVAFAQPFGMDDFLWTSRPLLVFAPSAEDAAARRISAAVAQARDDFLERDMVLIQVYEDDVALLDGKRLPAGIAGGLRARYRVAAGESTVILVGKDGGEKLRAESDTDLEPIFLLIDGMPMRKNELLRKN